MFLLIDKPVGLTSHQVIKKIRQITGEKKVGHSGTLDPLASGLLVVALGRNSTRRLGYFLKSDKVYEAEIFLGEERTTDDSEGEILKVNKRKPVLTEIKKALKSFQGENQQIPPLYSAIKIKGKKAYDLARKGLQLELKPRKVFFYSLRLIDYKYPLVKLTCRVSAGTYIRALARDLGHLLGTGAYLKSLRRLSIGDFSLGTAVPLDKLTPENWQNYIFDDLMIK